MTHSSLCIIGGGATALAFLQAFLAGLESAEEFFPNTIYIIEKSGVFGRGLAYKQQSKSNILNMPACTMSLIPEQPNHFVQWLGDKHPQQTSTHPPRTLFGEYLTDQGKELIQQLKERGVNVIIIRDEATSLTRSPGRNIVQLQGGLIILADKVILALGNHFTDVYPEVSGAAGYHASPYNSAIYRDIPENARVLVIGSRLSAIDTALILAESKHVGEIVLSSRGGRLPAVTSTSLRPYTPKYLCAKTLEAAPSVTLRLIFSLLKKELGAAFDWTFERATSSAPALDILRDDIARAKTGPIHYQEVLRSLDENIGAIWRMLPQEEKLLFQHCYASQYYAIRYSIPIVNAQKIQSLMERGRLGISHDLRRISQTDDGCFLATHGRSTSTYDHIINASGPTYIVRSIDTLIVKRLLSDGIAQANMFGGFEVVPSTGQLISSTGDIHRDIFCIGGLTKGVHFYTNALSENVRHAHQAANHLLNQLRIEGEAGRFVSVQQSELEVQYEEMY